MTNQEAFDRLNQERPVIVAVLRRNPRQNRTAAELAEQVIDRHGRDGERLEQLIRQAAVVVFEEAQAAGEGEMR